MLVNKLSQHPQLLKVGGELNNIWTEIGGGPVYPKNEYRNELDVSWEYTNNMTNYYTRSIEDAKSFKRHLMRMIYRWKTGGGRISYDWEKIRVINKSPHLINKISYIHGMFPGSKIIFIIRPIHEQVASMKMHFQKSGQKRALPINENEGWRDPSENSENDISVYPNDFKTLPLMWLRLNKIALEELDKLPREDYYILRYEDFVNKQSESLESIFNLLNLEEGHRSSEEQIIKESIKIYNTSTPGDPQKKWKKHLTEEEKGILSEVIEKESETINFINKRVDSDQ